MTSPIPVPDVSPAGHSDLICGPWATPSDIPERFRVGVTDEQWETILLASSEILYQLSGARWRGAGCGGTVTLRSRPDSIGEGDWPFQSYDSCGCWEWLGSGVGSWFGWGYALDYHGRHPRPTAVQLDPDASAVTSVLVNGVAMDPSRYRLSGSGWLERTDGSGWELCGSDTTVVTYTAGIAPPAGGVLAVIRFAIEMYKLWIGDNTCAIPDRATSVTRQGISITIDPDAFLSKMRTGIGAVDIWLTSVNPKGRSRGGSVWSPDIPSGTRG